MLQSVPSQPISKNLILLIYGPQDEPPTSVPELRRIMGMINQLGKFTPNLAELTQPLGRSPMAVGTAQSSAFTRIKEELSTTTTLALYDPDALTKILADASSYGLGAVLLQRPQSESEWRPTAFASRSMTHTQRRYARIEMEPRATTWACRKFLGTTSWGSLS